MVIAINENAIGTINANRNAVIESNANALAINAMQMQSMEDDWVDQGSGWNGDGGQLKVGAVFQCCCRSNYSPDGRSSRGATRL